MSAPVYRTGVAACARFASPTLQRACRAHRAALLETYATVEKWRYQRSSRRQYSAAISNSVPIAIDDSSGVNESAATHVSKVVGTEHSLQTESKSRVHQSIQLLDPYLPLELRSKTWLENLAAFQGVRDPASLPAILLEIDANFECGVLSSLALEQNRWRAFIYLTEALAKACHSSKSDDTAAVFQNSIFKQIELPHPKKEREIGPYVAFYHNLPLKPETTSSTDSTKLTSFEDDLARARIHNNAMGLLWQSLGRIVLAAADASRELSEKLMLHVHRVLSCLHNEDQMHSKIYQFDSEVVPSLYRKSPFLHLMSSRIMTTISDSSWKAEEDRVIDSYTWMSAAYASSEGLELKDLYPAVRSIGPEVWLDLVLWSCVHGEHIAAGASLLREIASSQGDSKWRSISWDDLIEENLRWTDPHNAQRIRARFDRVAGAHEGYSKDPPAVILPERTISKESVIALVNNMTVPPRQALECYSSFDVSMFDNLLRGPKPLLDRGFLDLVATRATEYASFNTRTKPGYFESVTDVVSIGKDPERSNDQVEQYGEEPSHAIGAIDSIHHRAIAAMLDIGDLNRTLQAFLKLQNWLDSKKQAALRSFLKMPAKKVDAQTDNVKHATSHEIGDKYSSTLSPVTLAAFLDLLVKHRMFELASWLLASEDPDGPFVTPHVRASAVFLPSLLRFATATKQYNIVLEVADLIRINDNVLTNDVLHSFTQAQMVFRQFDQAETTMRIMRQLEVDDVSSQDVLVLLREILRLEHELSSTPIDAEFGSHLELPNGVNTRQQLDAATHLLVSILQRRFLRDHTRDPQQNAKLHFELKQLGRIALSLGGELGQAAKRVGRNMSLAHRSQEGGMPLAAEEFNILLQGIVETRGPGAGRKLIEQWCFLPSEGSPSRWFRRDDLPVIIGPEFYPTFGQHPNSLIRDWTSSGEGVAVPNRQTMQIVIDAVTTQAKAQLQSASQTHTESASLLDARGQQQQSLSSTEPPSSASKSQTAQPASLDFEWDDASETRHESSSSYDGDDEELLAWCERIRDSLDN